MDGPGEYYAKSNSPVRERQMPYDFTYMWNPMNKINKIETDSQIEDRLTAVRREGLGQLGEKGEGIMLKKNIIDTVLAFFKLEVYCQGFLDLSAQHSTSDW